MNYYMAPLEGITGYLFRNAYETCFGGIDKYFTPFISPNQKRICRTRERNDVLPEHNKGMIVVPEILTNQSELFIKTVEYLEDLGYHEFNLNLGCPVGTVVSKKKGSGFLTEKEKLKNFLNEIYDSSDCKISIKTRIGLKDAGEFDELLDIFNEFPVYELIIHPRTREDYYKNIPNLVAFEKGYNRSKANVCYNGDIFSKENYHSIISRFPELGSMMFGRGILRYPGLIRFIKDRTVMKKHELLEFHNMIYESYRQHLYGDKTVLFKMKELWSYMIHSFEYDSMIEKRIKKAQKLIEYDDIIRELFSGYGLIL